MIKKYQIIFWIQNNTKVVETTRNMYPQLDNRMLFRLNKINKIKDYFMSEIHARDTMSKTLSKCITAFDYFDKSLLVLSVTSGGVSIASFTTNIASPVGITSASLNIVFLISNGIVKKILKQWAKRKRNTVKLFYQQEVN